MSDETQLQAEMVSALMDGELRGVEFTRALDYLEDNRPARETWDTYHLVGEVLRSGKLHNQAHEAAFVDRWRTAVASGALNRKAEDQFFEKAEPVYQPQVHAANDGWWRRVAGLASIAFVGILVWQAAQWTGLGGSARSTPTLAQLPAPAPAPVPASPASLALTEEGGAVMLRDPQLDALLAAHRQHGGVTALQMPAGFLRNATFNEASR